MSEEKHPDEETTVTDTVKKFQNGWTREVEKLMAEWADKAICYRWMHEKTERIYYRKDLCFMFPVIILSTVTGAANFALNSVITDPTQMNYAQLGLGGLSILTGIISTIANRLGYGSGSEAHKGSAVLWGKFQRLIAIELSLNPDERSDCMFFLKTCRTELDRLIERSPTIPADVIEACKAEFKHHPSVRKPEIIGDIDTTSIYDSSEARHRYAEETAIAQKKQQLKEFIENDLKASIKEIMKEEVRRAVSRPTPGSSNFQVAERKDEIAKLSKSGVVAEMRRKLAGANTHFGTLPGIVEETEAPEEHEVPVLDQVPDQVGDQIPETIEIVVDENEPVGSDKK
jgi:hypothetical protein